MTRRFLLALATALLAPVGAGTGVLEEVVSGAGEDPSVHAAGVRGAGSVFVVPLQAPPPPIGAAAVHSRTRASRPGPLPASEFATPASSGNLQQLRLLRAGHKSHHVDLPPPPSD